MEYMVLEVHLLQRVGNTDGKDRKGKWLMFAAWHFVSLILLPSSVKHVTSLVSQTRRKIWSKT